MLVSKFIDEIESGSVSVQALIRVQAVMRVQALLEAEAVEAIGAEAVDEIAASTSLV